MRRLQTYSAPGITVTFDPNLCIHSAVCLSTLPDVFDVSRRRWIRPEASNPQEIAAAIERCPSGALKYRLEGSTPAVEADEDAAAGTTIQASRNGPLLVQGDFRLFEESGEVIPVAGRAALCRCGGTKNQPFCDGSHRTVGFESRKKPAV